MSEKSTEMLHIPVVATMRPSANGTFIMTDAEYADVPADYVAQMLLCAFGKVPDLKPEKDV